jgi:exopolysaccharide biosynthesis WecB/TagA/CpsF family protein
MRTDRINFLDVNFDRLSFRNVKDRLQAATSETPYAYVVTPNVDHVVRIHREPALRELYDAADLCVCDSRILRLLARLRGITLPLVPGSDISAALFTEVIGAGDRVVIVGADGSCVDQLRARLPGVQFLHFEPPFGLRYNPEARRSAAAFIASSKARFALIAVGAPQQEMIAKEVSKIPGATGIGLCIGAGLDFITGKQKRAPRLLQALGLEWAHRLATNPRRLWRRYLVEDIRIFWIWLRWRARSDRQLLILLAIVAAGLLTSVAALYAAMSYSQHRATGSSVNATLPPLTAQSVAAIKALPPPNLVKPVSPEEAAKENAERPFTARPDTPASRFVLHADGDNRARALTCLAQAIYYEAASEGVDGGRAVAQVVLNRVRHPGFPSTICGVVYEGADRPTGCQFSFTCDGSMQRVPIAWLWARSKEIAEEALKGRVYAPVGHATHYHADYVLPYWADSLDKSVQIGRHIFYRLRGAIGDARGFSQHYGGAEPPFKVPGAAVVMPQTAETQQVATALMAQPAPETAKDAPKASPTRSSPLVADTNRGTLLADVGANSPKVGGHEKQSLDCSAVGDRHRLSPLRADDMRASADSSGC